MSLWVDWSGTAQSVDAGLRGATELEANVGRPGPAGAPGARGPVGPGADEAVAVNFSQQAGTAFRGALAVSNDVGVIFMGDSKTSGTGVMLHTNRWQNRLGALLRTQYPISGGDTGRGVIPAHMPDAYNQMSGRPVWSAGVLSASTQGLGLNTAHIPAGETVTFPAITLPTGGGTIHVGYHTNNGLGTLEVVTGTTVRGTYNCVGAGSGEPKRASFTLPAGTHTIVARAQAGGNPARISYIDVRTSNTGIHLIDSARAGACAYHVARGPIGAPTAPASYKSAVAQLGNLALAVVAYGANDMSENSPTQYAADMLGVYTMLKETHPRIGVLFVLPAALTGAPPRSLDPATGVVWNYRAYHAAVRRVLDGEPDVSIVSEAALIDLLGPNMDRWLADTVHPKEFGHEQIAHATMGAILGLDRQGAKGDTGTGNVAHAATHAIGGTDVLTAANIGAMPSQPGYVTGDIATAPLGTYRVTGTTTGLPSGESVGFLTVSIPVAGVNHRMQRFTGLASGAIYVRTDTGTGSYGAWVLVGPQATPTPQGLGALADPLALGTGTMPQGQRSNGGVLGQAFNVNTFTDPGMWWVSGQITTANGFPWTPHAFGMLINEWMNTANYMRQTVQTSQDGWLVCVWTRINRGGTWGAWTPLKLDTGWRSLPAENGWTGNIYVKRTESLVHVVCTNLVGSAAANTNLFTLPGDPYRPGAGRPQHGLGHVGSAGVPGGSAQNTVGGIGATGGTYNEIVRVSAPVTSWTNGSASMSFPPASTGLPSTLPGTSA